MIATPSGWYQEIHLTIDQGLVVMTCTEPTTVKQMILDTAVKLGVKQLSVLHWNTRLSELAIAADFCSSACYTYPLTQWNGSDTNTARSASPHEPYVAGAGNGIYTLWNFRYLLLRIPRC